MSEDMPSPSRRRPFRKVAVVLASLATLYLGIGAYVSATLTHPHRHIDAKVSPANRGLLFENVHFPARGGDVSLAGWFMPSQPQLSASASAAGSDPAAKKAPARRAVVIVHGKDSNRTREFGGHGPEVAQSLLQRDMAVLMFDLRGHGESGPARFTLGLNESRDILGAVDYLIARGYAAGSIGVYGQSMGAAATIYATASEPAIGAAITDCAFSDIRPVLAHEWHHTTGLPNIFFPVTRLFSFALSGVDMTESRPVSVISRIAPRPLLIIHGDADKLVPVDQAYELHSAMPSAELWIIPGAGHVGGYRQEPAEFLRRIDDFFDHHLPR